MDGFISFAKSLRPTPRDLAEADQELGPVDSTDIHDTPAARYRFAQFLAACRYFDSVESLPRSTEN